MTSIKIYSEHKNKSKGKNHHCEKMMTRLNKGTNDWVHNKEQVHELAEFLEPNNILVARESDGMFNVKIATIVDSHDALYEWAIDNKLNLKDYKTLNKFIEKVRIIWQ